MDGYTLVKDIDIKVVKRMLPLLKINFEDDLGLQGEITIDRVRKYKHNYFAEYFAYTCEISYKGKVNYPKNKSYDNSFYNSTWRGNKIRLNKRVKRMAVRSVINELKVLGLEGLDRNFEITKINW